jgi:hypothetical protein
MRYTAFHKRRTASVTGLMEAWHIAPVAKLKEKYCRQHNWRGGFAEEFPYIPGRYDKPNPDLPERYRTVPYKILSTLYRKESKGAPGALPRAAARWPAAAWQQYTRQQHTKPFWKGLVS